MRQLRRGSHHAAQGFIVSLVGGGARGAPIDYGANGDRQRLLGDVLVNGVVGKARQRVGDNMDLRLPSHRRRSIGKSLRCGTALLRSVVSGAWPRTASMSMRSEKAIAFSLSAGRHFANAAPTFTLRKRAGEAPWPVPMVCMGWPLPQLGVPHSVQYSRRANGVAGVPEIGGDAAVTGIFEHAGLSCRRGFPSHEGIRIHDIDRTVAQERALGAEIDVEISGCPPSVAPPR